MALEVHRSHASCPCFTLTEERDRPRSSGSHRTVVYAAFKGMGDLLNASPVITSLLNRGVAVKLLLFPGKRLEEFVELVDFGKCRENLETLHLPVSGSLRDLKRFIGKARQFKTDLIWISPHAPRSAASWKIPLLLWITKVCFWPRAVMGGASTERFSFLFGIRVSVDRKLPLAEREAQAFSMAVPEAAATGLTSAHFIDRIQKCRIQPLRYDLLIHPGANASNRSWPFSHYEALVKLIPADCRIGVLGLLPDIELMRRTLPAERPITYINGSLEDALVAIAASRVVFCMDSGTAHFAQALNVPAVALFGKSDPGTIIGRKGIVVPIYERKFTCQPCGKAVCNQPEVYCMNSIRPESVAKVLCSLLGSTGK